MSKEVKAATLIAVATVIGAVVSSPVFLGMWGGNGRTDGSDGEDTDTPAIVDDREQEQIPTESSTLGRVRIVGQLEFDQYESRDSAAFAEYRKKHYSLLATARKEHDVNRLHPLDAQISVQEVPPGTYFLLSDFDIGRAPEGATARLRGLTYTHFEVHKTDDGSLYFLGFCSSETATRLARNGRGPAEATLAALASPQMPALVSIPMERIIRVKRTRNIPHPMYHQTSVLDVTVE